MTDTYTCEQCGGTFEKGWTDEEAQAEAERLWGEGGPDDPATVCDDCFNAMNEEYPVEDYLRDLAHREQERDRLRNLVREAEEQR